MKANLCLKCQEKAVYHRKYSGEKLCSNCFNHSLIEKTRKTISKYNIKGVHGISIGALTHQSKSKDISLDQS